MTTLARKQYNSGNLSLNSLENSAIEKDQDYELERTYYVYEDGSAIWKDSWRQTGVVTKYGRSEYHQDTLKRILK